MSNARNLANLLESDGDIKVAALDNAPAPTKSTIDALGIAATSLTGSQATAITNNATAAAAARAGRKNLIINGSMDVAQRATTATGVGSADGYFALDRWGGYMGTTGRFTMSQSTDAPIGFAKSMKLDCTTADTSIAAGEYAILRQGIEAHNIKGMARGTSGAKEVTVSFYVKGTAATYVCEMQDEAGRELSKTFNVTTAWERVELTFPADTNAAAATTYDNTIGVDLYFWIQAGSNYTSGTIPTTWANQSNTNRCAGIGNFFSSTSNELYITGVQLETGSVATDFEHRSYGEELQLCERYFQKVASGADTVGSTLGIAGMYTAGQLHVVIGLSVTMRLRPTVTVSSGTNYYVFYRGGSADYYADLTCDNGSSAANRIELYNNSQIAGSVGHAGMSRCFHPSALVTADAEL